MLKQASPILSSSDISRSMARILAFVSSERWASLTVSRYLAISNSMLSLMPSYFSIRVYSLLNVASLDPFLLALELERVSSSVTMPNIRCIRSEKARISFWASSTESSGVFMKPAVMKCRRKSSSSSTFFGLMTQHTKRSICGMNQMRINVLATLNVVWKAASTKVSLAELARNAALSVLSLVIATS